MDARPEGPQLAVDAGYHAGPWMRHPPDSALGGSRPMTDGAVPVRSRDRRPAPTHRARQRRRTGGPGTAAGERSGRTGPDRRRPGGPAVQPGTTVCWLAGGHGRGGGRLAGPPVLDPLGPLARRGAHRQHRPPAPPRDPLLPEARRRPAAVLRPAPLLDGVVRHLGRGRPVAVRRVRGDHPPAGLAGRQAPGGQTVAWAALLLVATSPFAVRYDTETRMYSLVALLTVLGFLALDRSLRRPRAGNLIAVARRHRAAPVHPLLVPLPDRHRHAVAGLPGVAGAARLADGGPGGSLVAVVVGCLTFLPWLPTFLFQSRHTGTPWATPATFAAMVNAVASFAGGGTNSGPGPGPHVLRPGRPGPVRRGHRPAPHRPGHPDPAAGPSAGRRGGRAPWPPPSPAGFSPTAPSTPATPRWCSSR